MLDNRHFFTSESVTAGHPDKMCDQISDAILDAILAKDKEARVACEAMVTTGLIFLSGEISTNCYVDFTKVVRETVADIGYVRAKYGFDAATCAIITSIDEQSADIADGVNLSWEQRQNAQNLELVQNSTMDDKNKLLGAGDQGIMFGFACKDTTEMMPMPISLAHRLARQLNLVRVKGILPYLRPDGKVQVTVEYLDDKPVRVDTVVCSSQHSEDVAFKTLETDLIEQVIKPILPVSMLDTNTRYLINPSGRFIIGGPMGDAGLTGRKIIIDTYGGYSRHGGGAFSGKDPTKVDRSGAYAARYIAKNIVAADLADRCEVQLAYAIGVAQPVSIYIDTFGTGKVDENLLINLVKDKLDLSPSGIINKFQLLRPIYRPLASYGHFGRKDLQLPWEDTDLSVSLKDAVYQISSLS